MSNRAKRVKSFSLKADGNQVEAVADDDRRSRPPTTKDLADDRGPRTDD